MQDSACMVVIRCPSSRIRVPLAMSRVPQNSDGDIEMADDLGNRGPRDRGRIALDEPHEVHYWTRALGVTEAQLRAAIQATGDATHAVRRQLQSSSPPGRQLQMG